MSDIVAGDLFTMVTDKAHVFSICISSVFSVSEARLSTATTPDFQIVSVCGRLLR